MPIPTIRSGIWLNVCFAWTILWNVVTASASFTTYAGDATQEAAWRAALGGNVPMENFEGFTGVPATSFGGDALAELPSVHVRFDSIVPGVYDDGQWAHSGSKQWCNWAGGAGNSSSHILRPAPGRQILALGFWNTDPQGDQPMEAYSAAGQLIGTISGLLNTHNSQPAASDGFAAFISTVPIAYIKIPGGLGDGWNHFDDLQVITQVSADYNHNGVVDGADYVVWRDTLNQTGSNLAADGAGAGGGPDGVVNQFDYDYWRDHFGDVVGAGSGLNVIEAFSVVAPESTTILICAWGIPVFLSFRARATR